VVIPVLGDPIDWPAIEAFLERIVPVSVLAATPQDHAFHSEGDVWTHTKMVVEALVASAAYAGLDPEARSIVGTASLLHDIGKPSTTREENGKLTSRGHSARGEQIARVALWRLGVPFAQREHVCSLIRHHQVPFFGIAKPDAERLAIKLSLVTRNDWLTQVADADGRGRRCADPADQTRIVDHCALWAAHCAEHAVLDAPRAFASDHTRRVWLESEGRHPDVAAHDDTTCEVTLLAGLPASGKSTWLAAHPQPTVSLDDLRADLDVDPADGQAEVIAAAREQARGFLRSHTSFAWNATNLTRSLRGQLLELFRGYRARTHILYFERSEPDLIRSNAARPDPVPRAAIDRMIQRWTVPDPSEAHRVTYMVEIDPKSHAWPPGK
jgi:putative nucleotidyltransferase with HDIG domain